MQLSLYNSLTRRKEVFQPLNNNSVKMYVCGPTVYDRPHIGNARSTVVYDILYRLLGEIFGHTNVIYVRNITDVDDKIINKAQELDIAIKDLTYKITQEFHNDMQYLGCQSPSMEPKATEHINDMIMIIEKLLKTGHAYIADNHVYFDVKSYKDYTKLSGQELDEMIEGTRVQNSTEKKHPQDFVLWKPSSLDASLFADFDSPWGKGRPGWHIECSAMSYKYLGEDFDIHGGGADLIFPHHTNEIAQSKCAFPGSQFAKYWIHNGFLTVDGEKMSKSLGNFITVKNLIDQKFDGEIVRLFLLSTHYRKPLDYNDKALADAKKTLDYWYRALDNIEFSGAYPELPQDFLNSLLDDLNTPLTIKIINDYAKAIFATSNKEEKLIYASLMIVCSNFIGLMTKSSEKWFQSGIDEMQVNALINERTKAKLAKDWNKADMIRQQLLDIGIALEDIPGSQTKWRKMCNL